MEECSIFVDESGDTGTDSDYYLLTLVFHNQSDSIEDNIRRYENRLHDAQLPDIPFHMDPLMSNEGDYAGLPLSSRARMLNYFHEFAVKCPIRHFTFVYEKKLFGKRGTHPDSNFISKRLGAQMQKDIEALLNEHLPYFQSFGLVKVYYDDGQKEVTKALRASFSNALSNTGLEFKAGIGYRNYRLCQIADMLCGFAFLDLKFKRGIQTKTDLRFADDHKNLRKRFLKKIARLVF